MRQSLSLSILVKCMCCLAVSKEQNTEGNTNLIFMDRSISKIISRSKPGKCKMFRLVCKIKHQCGEWIYMIIL